MVTETRPSGPRSEPVREKAERRQAWLSAWGTFLAGAAALFTLLTAAASTYVAYATYQDQRRQDAQDRQDSTESFAKRINLWHRSGLTYLENRNLTVARRATLVVSVSFGPDTGADYTGKEGGRSVVSLEHTK